MGSGGPKIGALALRATTNMTLIDATTKGTEMTSTQKSKDTPKSYGRHVADRCG